MAGYEHTTIVGYVGKTPELRYTQGGIENQVFCDLFLLAS